MKIGLPHTKAEKLDILKSLESSADSCIHEISNLLDDEDISNIWGRAQTKIQDQIEYLEAEVEFENED